MYTDSKSACSSCKCLSGFKNYHPAVLCTFDTLSCLQVLANVVAKLPPCEAIQLQRVSQ